MYQKRNTKRQMTRIPIPLVGGSYTHNDVPFDRQETVNMFPERGGAQSNSPALLRLLPGLKPWVTLTNGEGSIRGMYRTSNDRLFVVRGRALVEIDADGTETLRKLLTPFEDGIVPMTDNGVELSIADGSIIYSFTLATNSIAPVLDSDAPDTTPVLEYIDGYIFGFDPDSASIGTFRHSAVNDVTTWEALDVYTAEGSPDRIVTMRALNRTLWIFGSDSFEVWYNTGDSTLGASWAPLEGSYSNIGCGAQYSLAVIRARIFWLGASREGANIIWMAGEGYEAKRISNRAIESQIAGFDQTDDAWGFAFEYEGHHFYVLTFQTGNKTFVYDITENEWVNWAYLDPDTGVQNRSLAVNSVYFNNTNYVGSYEDGEIYELSKTTYTDNDNPRSWERYFPYFDNLHQRITWRMLEIEITTGTGLLTGQGSDPKIQIRWSDNGGRTFGKWHEMTLGLRGKYGTRVMKRLLGQSRNRVYHIRGSEPIPLAIQDNTVAEVEVSVD